MIQRQGLGRRGEQLAARHLEDRGMAVLARNLRLPFGEIDLVARDGEELVFVEVKTRIGDDATAPDELVDAGKLARLERLAETYVDTHAEPDAPWRIDVVAIVLGRDGRIVRLEHQVGAFL